MLLDPPPRFSEEKASRPLEELAGIPHSEEEDVWACVPPKLFAGCEADDPLPLPNSERMSALFFLDAPAPAPLNDVVLFEVTGEDKSRSKKPPPLTWAVVRPVGCTAAGALGCTRWLSWG